MANIQERITKDGKKVYRVRVRMKGYVHHCYERMGVGKRKSCDEGF